jgi:hypothetical protein
MRAPRTRSAVVALVLGAVLAAVLAPAAPAPADMPARPSPPTGAIDLQAPAAVGAGARPRLRIRVPERADDVWPEGRVTIVAREHGGTWSWRTGERYQGGPLHVRLPELTAPGSYDVRVTFRPWRRSPYDRARAVGVIRVVAAG